MNHDVRAHIEHIILHLGMHVSHSNCPECRADTSRRFAGTTPFVHLNAPSGTRHKYLDWVRPRLEAIRNGDSRVEAIWWHRDFMAALHRRISSHVPNQNGRKHAPEYAKYHLATYGNDYRFLHGL